MYQRRLSANQRGEQSNNRMGGGFQIKKLMTKPGSVKTIVRVEESQGGLDHKENEILQMYADLEYPKPPVHTNNFLTNGSYQRTTDIKNTFSTRNDTQINEVQVLKDGIGRKLTNHFKNRPFTAHTNKEFSDAHMNSDDYAQANNELDFLIKKIAYTQKESLKQVSARQSSPQEPRIISQAGLKITNRPMTSASVRSVVRMKSVTKPRPPPQEDDCSGINRYIIQHTLGTGSYAQVRLGRDRLTEQKVAIKTYMKSRICDPQKRQNLRREIFILKKLDHEGIIKLYNTIDTPQEYHLIMEYGGTTSLRQYMKTNNDRKLPEDEAKLLFRQVVRAIDYCHHSNVVHRDIKMENILLNERKDVKLIDFGFGVMAHTDTKLSVYCGTPCYMPPEIVSRQDYLGRPADIWSLGVLLYAMVSGSFPFKGKDDKELFSAIKSGRYKQPKCGVHCQKLISRLLRIRPTDRPDTTQILQDSWFSV